MTGPEQDREQQLTPAMQALLDGDGARALELLRQALAEQPDDPVLLCNCGAALLSLGQYGEAAAHYQRAAALGGQPEAILTYNLGIALAGSGDPAGAESAYRRALELDPKMAQGHGNLGVLLYLEGDFAGAETSLQAAIALAPQDLELRRNLGAVRCAAGDGNGAARAYRAAINLAPDDAAAVCGLATGLLLAGRGPEAVAALQEWDGERGAEMLRQLALAQARSGDPVAAEAMYRELRQLAPDDAWVLNGLGAVLETRAKHEEAQACFRTAIELQPSWADAHYNLGVSLEHEGRVQEAVAAYQCALELDPEHRLALKNRAGLLRVLGRNREARDAYEHALRLEPTDEVARHLLAALDGDDTLRAPAGYVREIFDGYAARYDEHMQGALGYRAPQELLTRIERDLGDRRVDRALDLGCGTGLMGRLLRPHAGELIGVDLSPQMLQNCAAAGYDQLVLADIVEYCQSQAVGSAGLCTASDVLNYLGDLSAVFAAVARVLRPGGLWAFSVEAGSQEAADAPASGADSCAGYQLTSTGRYRHRRGYVEACAEASGLRVLALELVGLRLERGREVAGLVAVMVRS